MTNNQIVANLALPTSAYIHIPFCRRRCYYCDFPISVLGNSSKISPSVQEYIKFLLQEIKATSVLGQPLTTIFFGGGTPSLICVYDVEKIISTLAQHFGLVSDVEISMEIDPATFSASEIKGYVTAGVNRVSLGVQAFQEELLTVCGRSHSVNDIYTAVDLIRQAGVTNLSLDLISGLPDQTLAQWEFSLSTAIALTPNHLSCYDLVLEPVTAFGRKYEPGVNPLPSDELTAQMYQLAQQKLTQAGYEHYEISNYAQPGYQCHHNRVYWENKPYYGFGMGAASYILSQRFTRPRNRQDYYAWVKNLEATEGKIDCPQDTETDLLLDTLMLGLRLAEGVNLSRLRDKFGQDTIRKIITCLEPYQEQGLVQWQPESDRLRLTDPDGFLVSNTILASLFAQF